MMGRESKVSSVFSWADEVEKEEQEAAAAAEGSSQAQPLQWQKKPNPFGSARPREVVLQDKGIDWRQLDLHLQQPSPLLESPVRSPTVTVSSHPQIVSTPQIQNPILLVPPLRYPPKYVAGFLYEHWACTAPHASGYQHFKLEKEKAARGVGKLHKLKSESALCEIGNTGRRRTTELVEAKGNFHGLPLVNQKTVTPEMHHKTMSLSANGIRRQPRNIQVDSGMDENNDSMEHKWQKVTKKRRDLPVKQVNDGVPYKFKGDGAGLGKNKMNFEKKGIKLQT